MKINITQDALHIGIRIQHDQTTWHDVASVFKRWTIDEDSTPLFPKHTLHLAVSHLATYSQPGVKDILTQTIYHAIAAHLAYQLDEMFKTQEDFKRPVRVVQYGPVFYVEWVESSDQSED